MHFTYDIIWNQFFKLQSELNLEKDIINLINIQFLKYN